MPAENEPRAADADAVPIRPLVAAFRVDVHHENGGVRVAPVGELDVATVGQVERQLLESSRNGARELLLDLRGLQFMDSTGVHLVLNWQTRATQHELDFALIAGSPMVQRVFEASGLLDLLPFRAAATAEGGCGDH